MTYKQTGRQSLVSRLLAAVILTSIYCFSLVGMTALVTGASTTAAFAQRGDRGDRGRGRGRGYRGRGEYRGDRGRGNAYGDRGRGRGGRPGACVVNAAGVRMCL
ncbi:hypothetical protein [Rhodopseudomonas pseudopalustris]|uniref:Uncharacterized protein n=1 Tax=Rhodopseudomonas pseudopalustris TaxID=1513892 RepID=A0A1H8RQ15_9BRAD|nr:hypothetical protein [Rhodopseudomonas pseudopalustris]SEO68043.1 hypothetical protein SAMN05444123_10437 [Rhodopseudomonas pseudopalustris]